MIGRVTRLVRAEFIKLFAHPFLYLSLAILVLAVVSFEILQPIIRGQEETVFKTFHSLQLFVYGFKFGLFIASVILLIFSSMIIAGEFDKGTVKNLLTRPITRLEFFLAKCVTIVVLAILLYFFLLYVSLFYAFLRGDMGHVWAEDHPIIVREYAELSGNAWKAVFMSFLPFLAVGFLGIFISNWTESSGYAVAMALVLFIFGYLVLGMMSDAVQLRVFLYYPDYALDKLRTWAEGANTSWDPDVERDVSLWFLRIPLCYLVPLCYIAAFPLVAFGIFRSRNIHA